MHNLCTFLHPPPNVQSLLGLGLKFCLQKTHPTSFDDFKKSETRFKRDLYTKLFFLSNYKSDYDPAQLWIRTEWTPDESTIPIELRVRAQQYLKHLRQNFKFRRRRRRRNNLTPYQNVLLRFFLDDSPFIIVPADKNLSTCILERRTYLLRAFQDHLADHSTY